MPPKALDARVAALSRISRGRARALVERGKVFVDGARVLDPGARPADGARVEVRLAAPTPARDAVERARLEPWRLLQVDGAVVVVDKPAGLSTVPYEPGERALVQVVEDVLRHTRKGGPRARLHVVHRLDRGTSGVVVFARTLLAQRMLQQQFRRHSVARTYYAVAYGEVPEGRLESRLVRDRGDGLRGSTANPRLGRHAVTEVSPVEALRGATLVQCRPRTGRTHQIRIHLAEAGHPLVGEAVYARGWTGPVVEAPRAMLHAAELGFDHPGDEGRRVHFRAPPPPDFVAVVRALGGVWAGDAVSGKPLAAGKAVRVEDLPRRGGPEGSRAAQRAVREEREKRRRR